MSMFYSIFCLSRPLQSRDAQEVAVEAEKAGAGRLVRNNFVRNNSKTVWFKLG